MRGLEERLRLALEGTETGFWEWYVATDSSSGRTTWARSTACRAGPSPRACRTSSTASSIPSDRAALGRADRRTRSSTAPRTSSTCASSCPTAASAGCTPAPAPSAGRTAAPSASPACSATSPSAATARRRTRSSTPPARCSPRRWTRCGRSRRSPSSPSRGSPTGARCSSRPTRRAGRRRPRRPRQGPLGARAAGPLPARPGLADRRARGDPHRPLRALPGDRHARCWRPPRSTRSRCRLVRELQMHSVMVVPLTARDRTLGAMTFVWAESGRQYTTRELELAEELGRRAGLALDHARLFAREHARRGDAPARAAARRRCPSCPGFELVVRYVPQRRARPRRRRLVRRVPAARRPLRDRDRRRRRARDGRRGDDGPDPQLAARLRAQGRRPGRGDRRPAPLVDASARRDHVRDGRLRRARPATGEGELASAGHLPPLLVGAAAARATSTRRAARRSASAAPAPCTLGRFELAPGETLWLFTDGLVESRRRPIDVGPGRARRGRRPRRRRPRRDRRPPAGRAARLARRRHRAARRYAASARLRERVAQDPRHVHLRDADALGDLALHEVLDEAQPQHLALARASGRRRAARSRARPRRGRGRRRRGRVVGEPAVLLARHRRVEAGEPRAPSASRASVTSSTRHPAARGDLARRSGSGRGPGAAPRSTFSTRAIDSWTPRETWIVHVRSRKWRLSSPRIVGTA